MNQPTNPKLRHFTTRPGFAILVGFTVLALYFVWAAYDAAPTSLSFLTETPTQHTAVTPMAGMDVKSMPMAGMDVKSMPMAGMAMAGHGAGVGAMTPSEFNKITTKFVEDLSLPDGSVRPTHKWTRAMMVKGGNGKNEEKDTVGQEHGSDAKPDESDQPTDIYLKAMRFSYEPRVLRLKRDVRYRFRVMSMDVNHGVSIHTGFAGHIMRRPAMVMSEMVMTFTERGEFMVYCTVYCGAGHDQMKGKIIVE